MSILEESRGSHFDPEMLKANQILLELEGGFLIIPLQNVLSIEVSPLPVKLPQNTLTDVRLIS